MPNFHNLVDKVASQLSEKSAGEVSFTNLDLRNAYSQICSNDFTSNNLTTVGEKIPGIYNFSFGFYGLGDLPNEF